MLALAARAQKLIKATLFSPVTSVGSACSNLHARQAFSNTDIIILIVLLLLLLLQKTRPLLGPIALDPTFGSFYLTRTSFTSRESVSLVKVFRLERIVLVFIVWTQ
jgi:flagellar biogenesis protein FliO